MSDAAIANIVTGIVTVTTIVVGFLTLWIKLRYGAEKTEEINTKADELARKTDSVSNKIDDNTKITKEGTVVAATNARVAAEMANRSKETTEALAQSLDKKLNGDVDAAIEGAIKPLREALQEHVLQDETNMREIRTVLEELRRRK